jgi:hypothetical protein
VCSDEPMLGHKRSPTGAAPSQSEAAATAAKIASEAAAKVDITGIWPGRTNTSVKRPVRRS